MSEKPTSWQFHHVGAVVRDVDKAVKVFESLGMGPFGSMALPGKVTEETVYGKPMSFTLKVATAHLGPIELELIQPLKDAPIQEEYLADKGNDGFNHIGFKVKNFAQGEAWMLKEGFKAIQTRKRTSGVETAYFDTDKVGGVITELWQPPTK